MSVQAFWRVLCVQKEAFVRVVYPKYGFKTDRFHTFTRQLNLYQFARVSSNKDGIEFANEFFLRSNPAAEQVRTLRRHCDLV